MLGTFHRQKTADKTFLPADLERTLSAHMTVVSRALSTEHNKSAVFHQNHHYYILSAIILQKGPTLPKSEILLEFLGTIKNRNRRKAILNWAAKGLFLLRGGGGYTH